MKKVVLSCLVVFVSAGMLVSLMFAGADCRSMWVVGVTFRGDGDVA